MSERYSSVAIVLHWTIAVLIVGQIAGGLYMHELPRGSELKVELYQLHKSFGVVILLLSLLRLVWRLGHKPPPLPADMAGWEKFAARATHALFYVLMIGTPLLGWAVVSTASFNVPTVIFGIIELPHLPFFEGLENRKDLHELFEESHELAAKSIIGLLILHVGAALKHHLIDRDNVLAHMAPIFRRRSL
ncbi:MAG: cytochrome b [Parvularculaceae bacterium]